MNVQIRPGGRRKITEYNDLIKKLRLEGKGTVLIERDLKERYGVDICRQTIWQRLKAYH